MSDVPHSAEWLACVIRTLSRTHFSESLHREDRALPMRPHAKQPGPLTVVRCQNDQNGLLKLDRSDRG